MVVKDGTGATLSKTAFMNKVTAVTLENQYTVNAGAELFYTWTPPGTPDDSGLKQAFYPGQQITQSQIDALYPTGTVTAITPNTGPHGSTTPVVITGTNLGGATGVTFGAAAGTAFSVVNEETINVTAPTQASAGAVNVIVADDAGDITVTNGFTYS